MKKNNPKIKENITMQDKINVIEYIASSYFTENEEGLIEYTPYYIGLAQFIAAANFFMEGLEFDEGEDIYESVIADDDELKDIIYGSYKYYDENLLSQIRDIVDYRKQINIAKTQSENTAILTYKLVELMEQDAEKKQLEIENNQKLANILDAQNEVNAMIPPEMQKRFVESFDVNEVIDTMIRKYESSDMNKKNQELLEASKKIREQDNKIIELQTSYARDMQKDSVKNVLSENTADTPKAKRGRPKKTTVKKDSN